MDGIYDVQRPKYYIFLVTLVEFQPSCGHENLWNWPNVEFFDRLSLGFLINQYLAMDNHAWGKLLISIFCTKIGQSLAIRCPKTFQR